MPLGFLRVKGCKGRDAFERMGSGSVGGPLSHFSCWPADSFYVEIRDGFHSTEIVLGFVSGRSDMCRVRLGARGLGIEADRFLVLLLRSLTFV